MDFKPGEVYSAIWADDGTFHVVKVLEVDDVGVHIRIYKERFALRPSRDELGELSLGSVFEGEDFGVGHLPLSHEAFELWEPELIKTEPVDPEELEGYEMWASEPDAEVFGLRRPTLRERVGRLFGRGR